MTIRRGWVKQTAAALYRRVPARLTSAIRQNRLARSIALRLVPPRLSVIVPVYNVADYLGECLDSLIAQRLTRLQIIVVDDGSTDGSPAVIAEYARRDPRIHVIRQANAGLGAARNAGIARATAPYLTFLDSDDTIPPSAYSTMVKTLESTGSDFVVGAVRRKRHGRYSRPAWVGNVHGRERLAITIDDFPDAMQDIIACNRVFRREFWLQRIGPFPVGVAYEDHAPMVAAYLRAKSFDILARPTYDWRIREDASSIGQQKHVVQNLKDRITAKAMAWEVIAAEASPAVRAAWLGRVLDIDLSVFVEYAIHADEEYRQALREAVARFIDLADSDAWAQVRVDRKLRVGLAAQGRWAEADRLIEFFRLNGALPDTRVVDGHVVADLPFASEFGLPEHLYALSTHQTRMSACVKRAVWTPAGRLEVAGWAFISGIDLTDTATQISAVLRNTATGESRELGLETWDDTEITRWADHPNHFYDRAGFTTIVDVDALELAADPEVSRESEWQLRVSVATAGVHREGAVFGTVRRGMADRFQARDVPDPTDRVRFVPMMDARLGFLVQIRRERLRALTLSAQGRRLGGTLRAFDDVDQPWTRVSVRQHNRVVVESPLGRRPDGTLSFDLTLPAGLSTAEIGLFGRKSSGGRVRIGWGSEAELGAEVGRYGPGEYRWQRTPNGRVGISAGSERVIVHEVHATQSELTVVVQTSGLVGDELSRVVLSSPVASVGPERVSALGDSRYDLVFPLEQRSWGSTDVLPLPSGSYSLLLRRGDEELLATLSEQYINRLPDDQITPNHGISIGRPVDSLEMAVELRAPLPDAIRGRTALRRAMRDYGSAAYEPLDQVYFQCYRGEFATDSQRAIYDELVRRGTDLRLIWAVYDRSVEVPDGAESVIIGSQDWLDTLGRSRYICHNIDFDRFFVRRPFQKFLQTFHGYPFKSMGISFWRTKDFTEELIAWECARRNAAWTSILVPETFCEAIYRDEYRYTGEVLVTGYPRDDALVQPPEGAREDVLRRLGVPAEAKVILYAPTWRENSATGAWSAKIYEGLDVDALMSALGPGYVLLMRGHNYNFRDAYVREMSHSVLDVTRYPEINDLVIAADVALLDYSSLRFDWVITDKPVLFFVPDLGDYLSRRTALFDFAPTAPGPLLSTTAEVVSALQNLDAVAHDFAPARKEFNATYNRLHDGHAAERVVDAFFPANRHEALRS